MTPIAWPSSIAAIALVSLGIVNAAYVNKDTKLSEDEAELQAFLSSVISLTDAIRIAEKKTGAAAIAAEFEDEDGGYVFEVETLAHDGTETEVVINASTGEIIEIEVED
jgi:uncharacterized membrane protein YkoI